MAAIAFLFTLSFLLPIGSHAASNAVPPTTFSQPPAAPPMEMGGGMLAPGPAEDPCMNALFNMSDCLTYVEVGSQEKTPDSKCCPELAGLIDSQPICLCKLLGNSYSSFGIQFDVQKALKLPSVCGLDAPPASTCSLLGYPVNMAPIGAPSGAPMSTPDGGMGVPIGGPILAPPPGISSNDKLIISSSTLIIGISFLYTFLLQ
ncbi:non-specific lipid transfer protein GPI-anchored 12-like isoform X2 [Impatiens glandulifera]|uniref:non-specific lipid transfer protein GPI-anchored 12-like isoform X2 n=1 Tax=Impatiens glandulifera TaxID=253017 RepID=UPI001FB11D7A|nr:non-specific lipid transfer protein GPI-anchored 12-like isoform X2 [Impatiens glandulifera]